MSPFMTFLFGGIGATIIGVLLTHWLNSRRYHLSKLSNKTSIITARKNGPIVYPPVSVTQVKERPDITTPTNPKGVVNSLKKESNTVPIDFSQFFKAEDKINTKSSLQTYVVDKLGFDQNLTNAALFKDNTFSLASKADDKFFYGDQKKGSLLYSEHKPEKWGNITFTKKGNEISFEKQGGASVFSNQFVEIAAKKPMIPPSYDNIIAGPNSSNISSYINNNVVSASFTDKFVYADKEDGVILSALHDPSKWEQVTFKRTDDEIIYKIRKKSKTIT